MQTHGRLTEFTKYMKKIKDYESLISHYINEEMVSYLILVLRSN